MCIRDRSTPVLETLARPDSLAEPVYPKITLESKVLAVDELNSCLGLVRSFNAQKPQSERRDKLELILQAIQQKLFDMGSELATLPGDEYPGQIKLEEADAAWLEEVIDAMNTELEPLKSFILPGGTPLNAFLHQSRTTCRRAERAVLRLHRVEHINPAILKYLNRLSDALFLSLIHI